VARLGPSEWFEAFVKHRHFRQQIGGNGEGKSNRCELREDIRSCNGCNTLKLSLTYLDEHDSCFMQQVRPGRRAAFIGVQPRDK